MKRFWFVVLLAACGGDELVARDLGVATDAAVPDQAAACELTKPYSSSDTTCNECATLHCCVQINVCYAATSCDDDYTNCYLACGLFADADAGSSSVTACVADCGTKHPVGKQQFNAAIGCVDQHCATQCNPT